MDLLAVFGIRGRPKQIYKLEHKICSFGLNSKLVPYSVKLTVIKLLKEAKDDECGDLETDIAASIIAYCKLGYNDFKKFNGLIKLNDIEIIFKYAIDDGVSFQARIIMLMFLTKNAHIDVIKKFNLGIE